ncbi:MAG: TetR family transcriptional regulator [Nitriliruptorales bacterium]|nr:TetR family transcriptional regulator [Nitriliruptorales bacterium]
MPADSGHSRILEGPPRPRGRPRDPAIDRVVLEATLDELAANGYEGMSIDGIAARAGVSKPTIYRRWADKPALAIGAIAILVSQEGPPSTGDLVTDLSRQLQAAHGNLERSGSVPLLGTLLAEKERHPEFLEMYRERLLRPRRETLLGLLEEARERGEIRTDADSETASLHLIGFLMAKYLSGEPLDGDWITPAVELVLGALR